MFRLFFTVSVACIIYQIQADTCSEDRLQCSDDCKNIELCSGIGSEPIIIQSCFGNPDTKQYCKQDGKLATCSADFCSNPNAPRPFVCAGYGTLPSPYKCNVAYICLQIGTEPHSECTCAPDEYFELATGDCKTLDGPCPREIAQCAKEGDYGTLTENFCYTCDGNLNALVYRCAGKSSTIPRSLACTKYQDPTSNSSTTSTSTQNPITTTTSTTTTIIPLPTCTLPGQKFPVEHDCTSYYYCTSVGSLPIKTQCRDGSYYNANTQRCTLGTCTNS